MRLKKVWAVILAAIVMASMSACGDKKESDEKESSSESETTTQTTTEADFGKRNAIAVIQWSPSLFLPKVNRP